MAIIRYENIYKVEMNEPEKKMNKISRIFFIITFLFIIFTLASIQFIPLEIRAKLRPLPFAFTMVGIMLIFLGIGCFFDGRARELAHTRLSERWPGHELIFYEDTFNTWHVKTSYTRSSIQAG